jgi:hypothetical protein
LCIHNKKKKRKMGNGGSSESNEERSMRSIIETEAFSQRGWLNIPLFILIILAWGTVLAFFLVFWIMNTDLLGEPNIVWSNSPWFVPHLSLTLTLTQIPLFGLRTVPIEAPAIWTAVFAIVAVIFDAAVSLFYQGLWWKCTLNTGSFTSRENEICDKEYTELSVIAWFNLMLIFHAIATIFTGFAIYYSDTGRVAKIKAGVGRQWQKAKEGGKSLLETLKSSEANVDTQQKLQFRNPGRFANGVNDGRAPSWG